jgi:outer membrane receptor protein involved in Fe transport
MKIIRNIFIKKRAVIFFIFLMSVSSTLFAGNTGKIKGKIVDKQTGTPLIGANVMVKGSTLGSATDVNGSYYILQVPPGKHDLEVSYMGYHTVTVKDIRITVDLTTQVDVQMESKSIDMPTLVIIANQKIVQKDVTSTKKVTTREEIKTIPGFESTKDVFSLHGGTVIGAAPQVLQMRDGSQIQVRDESVKDIHIRGGRGGEILFMVDGMPVTHPIYGGRDVLDLNVVDIDAMELLTGAFNAEYGQAQSGVVNITTRSGGDRFQGGLEYKTSEFKQFEDAYNSQYISLYLGGPEVITRYLLPKIGINIPGEISYFVSSNGNLSDTPWNNGRKRDEITIDGITIKEKQNNKGNLNAKVNWDISSQLKMIFSYHGSWNTWSSYQWLWKNYPDNMVDYYRSNQNYNFRLNHTLSKSTFYNINVGYLTVNYRGNLNGTNPSEFWTFYKDSVAYDYDTYMALFNETPDYFESSINAAAVDPYGFYDASSYENLWRDDFTRTLTVKGDITSQIHPDHMIKTGVEFSYNDIRYVDIQDGGVKLSNYGNYLFNNDPEFQAPNGPFKEFGQNRWVFDAYPVKGSWYIQDKFEKETFIINAGIRFDAFMPGPTVADKEWKEQWENATGLKSDWSWIQYKFSPRFGISYPISVKTVLFFSYGYFNQLPELQFYYRDPYTGGFTGNPHLDFEQTVLYEFGFTHELANDWAIDIKNYTKDISNQVGTTHLRASLGLPVDLYDNKGYARARGIEFELTKRYSNFYSGKLTYTAQWANGYSSSAFDDYIRSITDFPNPIRERRLNWDVRHQIIFQVTIASPENKHINLFGFKLPDNWDITILSKASSGQPYTPGSFDPVEIQKTENNASGPWFYNTDIKIKKSYNINGVKLSLFADIFNLFNQKNVQLGYSGFNTWTGKPYVYGDIDPQGFRQYYDWYTIYRLMDPRLYSPGRYAKIGLRIDW